MKKILKTILPVLLLGFLTFRIFKDLPAVRQSFSQPKILPLVVSIVIAFLVYSEGALCWWLIVKKMGFKISFLRAFPIWIISNTSRYIPGSIWQYIGRVELAKSKIGLTRTEGVNSIIVEVFILLASASIVSSIPLVYIDFLGVKALKLIFLTPLLLILLHPKVANFLILLLGRVSGKKIKKIGRKLEFSEIAILIPFFILNFALNGTSIYFLVKAFTDASLSITLLTSFYALSWLIGYISFFAPAGIGATEVSLAFLLSHYIPLGFSSALVILYRFILTISEAGYFLLAVVIQKYEER